MIVDILLCEWLTPLCMLCLARSFYSFTVFFSLRTEDLSSIGLLFSFLLSIVVVYIHIHSVYRQQALTLRDEKEKKQGAAFCYQKRVKYHEGFALRTVHLLRKV